VASSFVDEAARRRAAEASTDSTTGGNTLADLAERLTRIEALLSSSRSGPGTPPGTL
jgi:hypothetical protein